MNFLLTPPQGLAVCFCCSLLRHCHHGEPPPNPWGALGLYCGLSLCSGAPAASPHAAIMLRLHQSRLPGCLHVLAPYTHPTCAYPPPTPPTKRPRAHVYSSASLPLTLDCPGDSGPAPGGRKMSRGSFNSQFPHPEPSARYPQALAFPDQLYDAVFDGAQVTSKTPIRLYGGALLSEYCWGRL